MTTDIPLNKDISFNILRLPAIILLTIYNTPVSDLISPILEE